MGDVLPDAVNTPGDEVTVYELIALPPLFAGALYETVAVVCPVAVADTALGAPGAAAAVTETDAVPNPFGLEALLTARI